MSSYPNHGSGNHNSQEEFQSIPFATSDSISKESNSAKSSRTQVPLHLTEEEMAHAHEIFAEERQRAKEERASHHNSQTSMPNRSTSSQPTYFTSPRNIGSASSSHRMPSLPSKGSAGNLNGFSGMVHGSPLQTSPTFSPSAEETSKSGGNKSATRSSRSPSMADQSSTSRSSGRGIRLTDEDIEIAKRIFAEERVSAAGSSRNASLTGGIGGRSFNGSMSKPFASRPSSTHSRGASAGPRSLARSHSEGNLSTTSRRSGRGLHLTDEDVEIAKRIFAEEHLSAAGSSRRGSMANRSITSNSSKHPHNQSCSSRPSSSRQAASAGRTRGSNSSAPTRPQPRQVKTTIRPPKTSTKRSKPTKPTAAKAPPSKASSGEGSTGLTRDRVRRLSSQKHSPRDHRIQRWQDDHHTPSESSQHASLSVGSANPSSLDSSKAVPPTTNKAAPSTQKMRNNDKKEVNVSTHKVRRASPAKRSSTRSSNNSTPKIPAAVKTAPKPPAPRVVKAPRSRPSIPHAPSNPSTSPPRTASIPARTPSKVLHRRVTSSSSRRSNPSQLPSTTSLRSPSPLDCTNEQHRMTPEQRPPHKMKLAPRSSSSSSKNKVSRNSSLDKKIHNNNSKNNITKPSVKKKKKLRSKHEAPPTSLPPLTDVERMVDDEEDFHGTGVEETVEAAEPKPPSEIVEGGVDDVSEWMDDGFDPPSMMFEPLVPGEDDDSPPRVKQLMAAANASPSPPPNTTSSTHSSIGASSPTPSKDLPNNSSNSNKHVGLRRTTAASVKGTSISVLGNSNVSQAEMVTSTALHNAAAALPDVPKPKRRKRSGERSGEATASSAEHSASLPSPNVVKKKKKKNQNHPDQQQPQSPNAMKTADQQPRNSVATPISPASNPSTKMPSPTNQPPHGNFADPASIPSTSSSTRAEKKASQQRRTSSAASDPSDHSPTASRKQLPMHRNSAEPTVASTPSTASSTREKTKHQQQPMRKTSSPQSIPPSPPSSRNIHQRQAHPSHISASSPTPAVTTRHASGEKAAAEVPHINHNPYMVEDGDGVPVDDFAMEQLILSPEDSPRGSTTDAGASKLTATQHPLTTDDSAQTVAAPAPRPSYVRSLLLNSVTLDSSRWSDGSDQPPSKNERCPAHDLPAEVAEVATPTKKKKKSKKKKAADPGESSEVVNPAEAVVLPVLRATEVMAPHPPASPHSPPKQKHRHRGVSPIPRPKSKHQGSDALPPIVTKEAAAVEEAATPRQQHRERKPSPPARPQRSMRVIEMSSTESSPTSSRCGSSYSVLLFIEPYEQRSSGVRLRPVR